MELLDKKYIPLGKQSKRAQREFNAAQRTAVAFNTGTRIHTTDKHPSRARAKQMDRENRDE